MAARSKARRRALGILFEADQRGLDPLEVLAERVRRADPPIAEYTVEIVEGVVAHAERIDELLSTYAQGWTIDRMPGVDRALLRLSAWELLFNDGVPDAVAIDEAVELARSLSPDESPAFVNGPLAPLLEGKPSVPRCPRTPPLAVIKDFAAPWVAVARGLGGGEFLDRRQERSVLGCYRAAGVRVEDAPGDELLGEHGRRHVVDD